MNIETTLRDKTEFGPAMYMVKVVLDDSLFEKIGGGADWRGAELSGITNAIAEKLVEQLLPEMEQRVFADPQFKDRVIGDVLVRIANRLADKGFLEKEEVPKENNI